MAVADKNTLKKLGINPYAPLLIHIRSVESYSYNAISGAKDIFPFGDLTKKTIEEILNDKTIKSPSSFISEPNTALGAYQILKKSLLDGYAKPAGLTQNDLFSEENQDLMAVAAIEKAIGDFRRGESNDIQKASEALCKIWAGLRVLYPIKAKRDNNGTLPKRDLIRGMSYYAGVSINPTDSTPYLSTKFESILNTINSNSPEPPSTQGIQPIIPPITPPTPITPIPEGDYLQFIQD